MKIIYHDPEGDVTYTRIARVEFSPEVDIKLNSLPVDMLTVDIITQDTLERGWLVSLKNDVDTLFAKFKITKVQRINKDTLRVEAVSPLWLMDWWTVGAERINTTAGTAVNDLFNGLPKSGYLSIIPYTLPSDLASVNINGFAPEQTARERLLWLCLAMGAWVQQSFCNGLVFHALPDFSNHDLTQGTLLPYKKTYWKPETQLGDPVHAVYVELIGTISTTETPDTESGTDEGGTTYYWDYITHGYTNHDEDAPGGSEVKITGISLLNNDYQQPTFSKLGALYMNRMEITAEIIDNGDVQPGDVVRVYTDEDMIYCGVVTQCVFSFGQQSKARLTISAFSDELPVQIVRVVYTADGTPLGQDTQVFPEGDSWSIDTPEIGGYTTNTASVTGSTGGTYTVKYRKIGLTGIKIIQPPQKLIYAENEPIDYKGLRVFAYSNNNVNGYKTQVKWTNGGQWLDGIIPLDALKLTVKKATRSANVGGDMKSMYQGNLKQPISYSTGTVVATMNHVQSYYEYFTSELRIISGNPRIIASRGINQYTLNLASDQPFTWRTYQVYKQYGSAETVTPSGNEHTATARTINGKTIYTDTGGFGSVATFKTTLNIPVIDATPNDNDLYTIVYGANTADVTGIPVTYKYNGAEYSDTFRISIINELPPESIEIVTPPTVLDYYDGQEIDYTGMVVRALTYDGKPWKNADHPGGIIPISELVLPQETAELTGGDGTAWGNEDNTINAIEVVCSIMGRWSWWPYYAYYGGDLGLYDGGRGITGIVTQGDSQGSKFLLTRYNGMYHGMALTDVTSFMFSACVNGEWGLYTGDSRHTVPKNQFSPGINPSATYDISNIPESTMNPTGVEDTDIAPIHGTLQVPVQWVYGSATLENSFTINIDADTGEQEEL